MDYAWFWWRAMHRLVHICLLQRIWHRSKYYLALWIFINTIEHVITDDQLDIRRPCMIFSFLHIVYNYPIINMLGKLQYSLITTPMISIYNSVLADTLWEDFFSLPTLQTGPTKI